MEYQIIWSNIAEAEFDAIIEIISTNQSPEKGITFIQLVYKKLDLLAQMPLIGVQSQRLPSIRRIIINKNYSLLYQVEKDDIHLIRFLDNRSAFTI